MANEISYSVQMQLKTGNLTDSYSSNTKQATQTLAKLVRNVVTVPFGGGSEVALALGGVVTPGFAIFVNLDATNFVSIGTKPAATFFPFMKLKAGESQMVRLSLAPYALADTLAVELFYIIYAE